MRIGTLLLVGAFSLGTAAVARADSPGGVKRPPEEMKGREGEPPPPGYHVLRKYQRAPFAVGATLFGVGWFAAAVGAAIGGNQSNRFDLWQPMFVPLIGPFITLEKAKSTFSSDDDAPLVAIPGALQILGFGLILSGLVIPKRVIWEMDDATKKEWDEHENREDRLQDEREREEQRRRQTSALKLTVMPFTLPQGGGIGVTGLW